MKMITCDCGCKIFEDITTLEIDELDFRVWNSGTKLIAAVCGVSVAKCIRCERIYVPSTSMMGKNQNDPEVQAYAELISAVSDRNNRISLLDSILDNFDEVKNRKCDCKNKININPIVENNPSEVLVNVKTAKRSRKDTKSAV